MAIRYKSKEHPSDQDEIFGLSTDTKPTVDRKGALLEPGSSIYLFDTKAIFLFDGISTWYAM
jgi:hypothetical protein